MSITKPIRHQSSRNIWGFVLFAFLFYYLPVILIWLDIIPFSFRFWLLLIMTCVVFLYQVVRKRTLKELGFRRDTLKDSLLWNGIFSFILAAIILILYLAQLIREPTTPQWQWFFVFYIFISSPSQEFLYRSSVFAEMNTRRILNPYTQIAISSVTYSFLHIIYNDIITLLVTLFAGIIWGVIYYKRPNFWGVALSHAVLGVISILVGLI